MPAGRRAGSHRRYGTWAAFMASFGAAQIAVWRLGDSSGTSLADASGNSRPLTSVGTPTLGVTGLLVGDADTAISFNGSSQRAIRTDAALKPAQLTFGVLIKPSDVTQSLSLIGGAGTTGVVGYRLSLGTGKASFVCGDGTSSKTVTAPSAFTVSTSHLVMGTYDGTTMRLVVDGVRVGTPLALSAIGYTGVTDFLLASLQGQTFTANRHFPGVLDEAFLLNRATTVAEERLARSIMLGLG